MANDLLHQAEALQNLLTSHATGGSENDAEHMRLRHMMLSDSALESVMPKFLRTCRNLPQFWQFIKYKHRTYADRREYIWNELRPVLEMLEGSSSAPSDKVVSERLEKFDAAHVQAAWSKALSRRSADPEGAITSSPTLIESVCKHILDASGVSYDDAADLPKLYKLTAELLNLAPSQHTEPVFK